MCERERKYECVCVYVRERKCACVYVYVCVCICVYVCVLEREYVCPFVSSALQAYLPQFLLNTEVSPDSNFICLVIYFSLRHNSGVMTFVLTIWLSLKYGHSSLGCL